MMRPDQIFIFNERADVESRELVKRTNRLIMRTDRRRVRNSDASETNSRLSTFILPRSCYNSPNVGSDFGIFW